ncbi:hypothetical protein IGI04_020787 [Brassica rapa subsp. trilocularis]|uniref:Uncharacterized protein n=1 Tax=Brassica rapa subsp. trilocularis TaxID=1813537 RepID=A0ABQ7MJP9_BRACM|nr:hypothetical protein IGI04_020787 [Brassica rapa subsp. trilocularis]
MSRPEGNNDPPFPPLSTAQSLQRTVCSSAMQQQRKFSENSLLGPEFVDYLDPPTFTSYELAAIATDISSVA